MTDRILVWVLIALAALNIFDYLCTIQAVYLLGVPEGNPLMDALLGTAWFGIVKLFFIPIGLYFVWSKRRGLGWVSVSLLVLALAAYTAVAAYHSIGTLVHLNLRG